MTDITSNDALAPRVQTHGGLYRAIWKWHFFAALFVLPFMAMLSITGGIYLYHKDYENWRFAEFKYVEPAGEKLSLSEQWKRMAEQNPSLSIASITPSDDPSKSTYFQLKNKARETFYAWLNPYTGDSLAVINRDDTLMRKIKKFHGELLLGKTGTKLVELATHWAIVLFVTGIFLWWPRGNRSLKQAVSPPTQRQKGRPWWRQLHLFVGFLSVILILPLLISGLPWTDVWGGGLSYIQKQTGQTSPSRRFGGPPILSSAREGAQIPLSQVYAIAQEKGVPMPINISKPRDETRAFAVTSGTGDRTKRVELHIDQYTGDVLADIRFSDYPAIPAAVSWGIGFHQGEQYGWFNKAQNTLAAILGVTLAFSGFVAWWMRRPKGKIGVPQQPDSRTIGSGVIVTAIALSVFLPFVGATLIVVLLLDRFVLKPRGWLQE